MADRITVSAVVLYDEAGRVLTVRKRGTQHLMFPGGKPEPGESAEDAAVRECAEELGVDLDASSLKRVGVFTAPAANETGPIVHATVFEHPKAVVTAPRAEIEHLEWVDLAEDGRHLAPLLRTEVFPILRQERSRLRRVTVFTGSASGASPAFAAAAAAFGRSVARSGAGIVYGGAQVGLMGVVADSALAAGGEVLGVMPQALADREIGHRGLTRLETVPDMHVRKNRMAELGDGFVALPGGAGTLEELFEVWTWQQLGFHAKPVALYDVNGFWQPLLRMLDEMGSHGFLAPAFRDSFIIDSDPDALLEAMATWKPQPTKWAESNSTRSLSTAAGSS